MVDPKQRSKRRSGSNKPRKSFTLYLCHNLDFDSVADTLDRHGIRYKRHREFFKGEVADTVLLPKVGRHRWILVTFDQKQRTRNIESELIKRYKIRHFVFTSGEIGDVGELLFKASRNMRNLCKRENGPFCASIALSGKVLLKNLR
jgi:PIN like domain